MIKLLLCDIDGTLITTQISSDPKKNRFYYSIKEIFGIDAVYDRKKFNGWTDYQILLEMVKPFGISKDTLDNKLDPLASSMIKKIEEISKGKNFFSVIPGVNEFLQRVHTLSIHKGVFTGNLEKIGKWKLEINHIDKFFTLVLFGDYMRNKTELLKKKLIPLLDGMEETIEHTDCCVIGDTPEDIRAGKIMGVKTVGVLTGGYTTRREMESEAPDLLISSLSDSQVIQFLQT